MSKRLLVEMFDRMVVRKDAALIPLYYDASFTLFTNGETQSYNDFERGHVSLYATDIAYSVRYDEAAWIEADGKVGARLWIETRRSGAKPVTFEVVLIARYQGDRIDQLWELTWPDWRQTKMLEPYE